MFRYEAAHLFIQFHLVGRTVIERMIIEDKPSKIWFALVCTVLISLDVVGISKVTGSNLSLPGTSYLLLHTFIFTDCEVHSVLVYSVVLMCLYWHKQDLINSSFPFCCSLFYCIPLSAFSLPFWFWCPSFGLSIDSVCASNA